MVRDAPGRRMMSSRGTVRRVAGGLVYNPELAPPSIARKIPIRLNQALFERGLVPPWILDADDCRSYWASRTEQSGDANTPSSYSHKAQTIVEFLHGFWQPNVTTDMSILEAGCNAGANLHGLYSRGYRHLRAVEINSAAVDEMRRAFPDLSETHVEQGALEDILVQMPTGSVDAVFSMAVLMHIHPSSNRIFAQMARIARRYVCTVEAEEVTISYIFARNYRRVFERLGCTQVRCVSLGASSDYMGYTARLFACSSD